MQVIPFGRTGLKVSRICCGVGSKHDDGHLYGYDTDHGIGGDSWIHSTSMINVARYVAVAPQDAGTGVRDLSFIP